MRAALSVPLVLAFAAGACKIDLESRSVDAPLPDVRLCKPSTTASICLAAEAENHADFAWIQSNIFATNCKGMDNQCHSVSSPAELKGRLDFGAGAAYASLLGAGPDTRVASESDPQHNLVEPGFPNRSYLLFILKGIRATDGDPAFIEPPSDVDYMPQKNNTLCCQKLDVVERWIAAGAPP